MNLSEQNVEKIQKWTLVILVCILSITLGCSEVNNSGVSKKRPSVRSIYIEKFGNEVMEKGLETVVTDALAKYISADKLYTISQSPEKSDSILSGKLASLTKTPTITTSLGSPRCEAEIGAKISWQKKTGEMLIENQSVIGKASLEDTDEQTLQRTIKAAAEDLAKNIVKMLEN